MVWADDCDWLVLLVKTNLHRLNMAAQYFVALLTEVTCPATSVSGETNV